MSGPSISESKVNVKKLVARNAAALGIICVVLVSGLAGTLIVLNGANSQITSLQNKINQLQDTYNSYVASHHYNDSEFNALFGTNASQLLEQVYNLTSILDLNESTVWFPYTDISQPANSYTNWTFYPLYAGYVVVNVGAASTPLTYIQVKYSLNTGGEEGVGYNNQVWCGGDSLNGGTGTFPVLPVPVEIRVGNTDNYTNIALVEITYYF